MVNASVVMFVWGLIVAAVGMEAFVSKKSLISLLAAGGIGLLIILGGYLLKSGKDFGFWLGVVGTIFLLGRFAPTFIKTKDMWPAGAMVVLSILALIAMFTSRRA